MSTKIYRLNRFVCLLKKRVRCETLCDICKQLAIGTRQKLGDLNKPLKKTGKLVRKSDWYIAIKV